MPQRGHTPDFLGPPPIGPAASFEEEIAAVRSVDPEEARRGLQWSLACTPGAADTPKDAPSWRIPRWPSRSSPAP